jgi:hypothetical protein
VYRRVVLGTRLVSGSTDPDSRGHQVNFLIWILAVIIAVVGIVQLLQGQIIFGILLLILACVIGPGGYSIFRSRHA